ncbi:MAG: chitin synthase 3, partial [Olpidium bornovanus]
MSAVMKNVAFLCGRNNSQTWGKNSWQKITVCIVADGRKKCNERVLTVLAAMGVYQEGVAKNCVNGRETTAHIFEYTAQLMVDNDLEVRRKDRGVVPVQILFCLKEQNKKKLNSHRWFFNAFGPILRPNICVLLDVGTRPTTPSIYHLWKAFDRDGSVAGACGEIAADLGPSWANVWNPLVAAQNFEYKMSNILDKPMESVFGYISVLPGAFSAYRYAALLDYERGRGPLSAYFKGETMHGAGAGVFEANMYLAEDRILCFELVAKPHCSWLLKYV